MSDNLSVDLLKRAEDELNENPQTRAKYIDQIRTWIQEQPYLLVRSDDFFILRFLRGCKFCLEKTKETISNYFTFRAAHHEWFKDRDPQEDTIRELFKKGLILPLNSKGKDTSRIFIFRQGIYDPQRYTLNDVMRTLFLLFDVFFEVDEVHQINGIVIIVDQKNFTFSHAVQYSPSHIKNVLKLYQDGYALQTRRLYILHNGRLFQILFKIAKLFMKEELVKVMEFCNADVQKTYKDVPKIILPKEYGGDGETVQEIIDHWLGIIDSKRSWILEDQKNIVDESKRPK